MKGIWQDWQSQTRLCYNDCHQRSVQHTHYRSLREHFQVVRWTVLSNDMLQANEWGWKMANNSLCPVMTDLDAAPAKVLQFIRCMCKSTGKNPCGTKQCYCHKNGLRCLVACNGQSCNNTDMTMNLDVDDDDDHHHFEDAEGNLDVWKGHQMTASHMVCYRWIHDSYVIVLSCYRTFKLLKRYFCSYAQRLDISLNKNTKTFKCAHDLPVAGFYAMIFANKIFSKRKYFVSNLQTCKYTLFEKFVNSKKYFRLERGWISRLKYYHDLHICTRPTCRGILCDDIRNNNKSKRK